MSEALADYLQVWGLEDDVIVFRDSSLGAVIQITGLDVSCKTDEECESGSQAIKNMLNSLPDGYSFQVCQYLSRGGSENTQIHNHELCSESSSKIAKELSKERLKQHQKLDNEEKLPKRHIYISIRKPPYLENRKSLLGSKMALKPLTADKISENLANLESVVEQIISHLSIIGLSPSRLKGQAIAEHMFVLWNPGRAVKLNTYDPTNIRDQLAMSDLILDRHGFSINNRYFRVITIKTLPDITYAAMSSCLLNLPIGTRYYMTSKKLDQNAEIEKLQTSRRIAFSMSQKGGNSVRDIESENKLNDLEGLLEEVLNSGERVFDASFQFVVSADTEKSVENKAAIVLQQIQSLNGAEGIVENLAGFNVFCESSFPNAKVSERTKKLKSTNVADLLPIYGFWQGYERPSIILRSRSGETVSVDPFDKSLTNANMIVSGGSGSGKSFLTNVLMLHMLKEDPRIFIIDIGGSYKKLCEHLDGQYISLGLGNGQAINPFDLKQGETMAGPDKLKFLISLIELITKEDEKSGLPKVDRSEVEDLIDKVYKEDSFPALSGIQKRLSASNDLKHYGKILQPWVGETPYGKFLDSDTTIDLQKRIVCFDLKELESYPDLQAACLLIITDYVWREVQSDISSKKFLIFDECWRLLENEAGSSFIANVFRTFRKYYASAIAISQNIDDFAKSKVSGAIMTNSAIKWILMQKGADPKRLQEVLRVNEREMELVRSLRQKRGHYSEAFLIAEDNHSVVSVETTPLEYWIATTDPREVSVMKEHLSNPESNIYVFSQKHPHGLN